MSDLMTQDIKCHHGIVITVSKIENVDRGKTHSMLREKRNVLIGYQENNDFHRTLCLLQKLLFFSPFLRAGRCETLFLKRVFRQIIWYS